MAKRVTQGCPCGFYGDSARECRCTPGIIQRYLDRPLLDRIDIHIEVPAVAYKDLRGRDDGIVLTERFTDGAAGVSAVWAETCERYDVHTASEKQTAAWKEMAPIANAASLSLAKIRPK